MQALEALLGRISSPRLGGAPPSGETLQNMFKAALRAPDHALLRPWRFMVVQGDARARLGELFVAAQREDEPDTSQLQLEKAASKPLRAPMIIVVIARPKPHPKVPEIEQLISAGAAAQNILLAAHAQGVGAMWRTGGMAYHPVVHKGLGLAAHERVVAFLYVGEVEGEKRNITPLPVADYVSEWQGD